MSRRRGARRGRRVEAWVMRRGAGMERRVGGRGGAFGGWRHAPAWQFEAERRRSFGAGPAGARRPLIRSTKLARRYVSKYRSVEVGIDTRKHANRARVRCAFTQTPWTPWTSCDATTIFRPRPDFFCCTRQARRATACVRSPRCPRSPRRSFAYMTVRTHAPERAKREESAGYGMPSA